MSKNSYRENYVRLIHMKRGKKKKIASHNNQFGLGKVQVQVFTGFYMYKIKIPRSI